MTYCKDFLLTGLMMAGEIPSMSSLEKGLCGSAYEGFYERPPSSAVADMVP